tara:strand:- start:7481 stop:7939 length:459 start_codon:yes stop_codon:yes gene_type:complete
MAVYFLKRKQVVPGDMATVFSFFENPMNLEMITPPWMHFKILSSTDNPVRKNTQISYRIRWLIFPMIWKSRISEYEENSFFVDEMMQGPYKTWYHRHLFSTVRGGIEITDLVKYELPFGLLGNLVHSILIRKQLEKIFNHRNEAVAKIFGPG